MTKTITTVAAFKAAFFDAISLGFITAGENQDDFERSLSEYEGHCRACECISERAIPASRTTRRWFAEYTAARA